MRERRAEVVTGREIVEGAVDLHEPGVREIQLEARGVVPGGITKA
jgi:hypothetical protein